MIQRMLVLLISGSSAFSKTSLNIWKFMVHVLLKTGLKNFEHYFASLRWVQLCSSFNIFYLCLFLRLEWKHLFQSCGHCWVFHICWHIECNTLTATFLRIWNSSTGISSPPLALFSVMFPKVKGKVSERQSLVIPPWGCRVGRGWGWRGGSGSDKAHLRFPGSS